MILPTSSPEVRNLFIVAFSSLNGDRMVEDITVRTDNLQKIFLSEVVTGDEEDELAFYMNKFNLDVETIQTMPALGEHIRTLLSETKSSEITVSEIEDELAFFISKFNLDVETLETMPAFEEHVKILFPKTDE